MKSFSVHPVVAHGDANPVDSYERALRALELEHPVIDPDSEAFNEDVMLRVYEKMKALVRIGTPAARAVELATDSQLGELASTTHMGAPASVRLKGHGGRG